MQIKLPHPQNIHIITYNHVQPLAGFFFLTMLFYRILKTTEVSSRIYIYGIYLFEYVKCHTSVGITTVIKSDGVKNINNNMQVQKMISFCVQRIAKDTHFKLC